MIRPLLLSALVRSKELKTSLRVQIAPYILTDNMLIIWTSSLLGLVVITNEMHTFVLFQILSLVFGRIAC